MGRQEMQTSKQEFVWLCYSPARRKYWDWPLLPELYFILQRNKAGSIDQNLNKCKYVVYNFRHVFDGMTWFMSSIYAQHDYFGHQKCVHNQHIYQPVYGDGNESTYWYLHQIKGKTIVVIMHENPKPRKQCMYTQKILQRLK